MWGAWSTKVSPWFPHSDGKWKTRRRNTPSEIPLLCKNSRVSCFLKIFTYIWCLPLCCPALKVWRDAVLKRCNRCVTELHYLNRIHTLCFYCRAKLTIIFHVYLLQERGHTMTSVHWTHSCWSVPPKQRHVLHMDRLCGLWFDIFEVNNRVDGDLETRSTKH